jgi:hypothetical protein
MTCRLAGITDSTRLVLRAVVVCPVAARVVVDG